MAPPSSSAAALSEYERRAKLELEQKYKKNDVELSIDSISPLGGPTTGNTRVVVRG